MVAWQSARKREYIARDPYLWVTAAASICTKYSMELHDGMGRFYCHHRVKFVLVSYLLVLFPAMTLSRVACSCGGVGENAWWLPWIDAMMSRSVFPYSDQGARCQFHGAAVSEM